jgi:BirA family biotin operon repressor/biotin-[acetyl-CoA-carboxylase] ligase
VLLNGRKLSGVLCESALAGRGWDFCVVGLGININLSAEELGPLQSTATSLSIELGRYVDRAQLLAGVLMELESLYFALQNGQFEAVRNEWADALETIGKYVSVSEAGGIIEGQAVRTDHNGALVIRLASGEERHVVAGDVS